MSVGRSAGLVRDGGGVGVEEGGGDGVLPGGGPGVEVGGVGGARSMAVWRAVWAA